MAEREDTPSFLKGESVQVPGQGNHQMDRVWERIRAEREGGIIPVSLRETVEIKPVESPAPPEVQMPLF